MTTLTAPAASDAVGITVGAVLGPALVALDNRALDGRGSIEFSLLAGAAGAGIGVLPMAQRVRAKRVRTR